VGICREGSQGQTQKAILLRRTTFYISLQVLAATEFNEMFSGGRPRHILTRPSAREHFMEPFLQMALLWKAVGLNVNHSLISCAPVNVVTTLISTVLLTHIQ
jgi:hypothetical protein